MIEKMQFLSITGPKADFDRVVDTYLSKYEMHLENALTEVKNAVRPTATATATATSTQIATIAKRFTRLFRWIACAYSRRPARRA